MSAAKRAVSRRDPAQAFPSEADNHPQYGSKTLAAFNDAGHGARLIEVFGSNSLHALAHPA